MRRMVALIALAACKDASTDVIETDIGQDGSVADTESDVPVETDIDTPPDTDLPVDTDVEPDDVVRFAALGDVGEGNPDQLAVGEMMGQVCADRGCDYVLLLGDNIYNSGVDGVDDDQFQDKFEIPYASVDAPFLVVLGNHDYGGEGLGVEFWKADYEIDYTNYSTKWTMPDRYYSTDIGDVKLLALDTNAILWNFSDDQRDFLTDELAQPGFQWKIVFGHHPYLSNGKHGNAGAYEGLADWIPGAEIPRGDYVRDFVEDNLCGKVDMMISGHDHNRQWLEPTCGMEFVVSGAGAKNTEDGDRGNPTLFEDFSQPGFFYVTIDANVLTGEFYDKDGTIVYSGTIVK